MSKGVVKIVFESCDVEVELNDSATSKAVIKAMPFSSTVSTWGEEIYFETPISPPSSGDFGEVREEVPVGTVAYWPPGRALCLFFGRTPASTSDIPRAASAVVVLGRVTKGLERLKEVRDRESVRVEMV